MSWSGGKDSAMALERALRDASLEVVGLLTTLNEAHGRVSIHGVRRELVEAQARSIGLPLHWVPLPDACTNDVYEARMSKAMNEWKDVGVSHVVHGDLFLEDVRAYREKKLALAGLVGIFPIWGEDTSRLARHCIDAGFRPILCSVDTEQLDARFCGRPFDERFLAELPAGVDPCGERGEFHTFVWDAPIFSRPIPVATGETILRDGRFAFTDLTSARSTPQDLPATPIRAAPSGSPTGSGPPR
jgi:uncharacterized protein (TIGR00290 family)